MRRRLATSEICLDKVALAAGWRMDDKEVKRGGKKPQMGQTKNRWRCPRGTSKKSSQKAKRKKCPAPWWMKELWRPVQAPRETAQRDSMGEGWSRGGRDESERGRGDKGGPQRHTACFDFCRKVGLPVG